MGYFVHQYREGFATNSSSMHSLVFLKEKPTVPYVDAFDQGREFMSFGESNDVYAVTKESKFSYLFGCFVEDFLSVYVLSREERESLESRFEKYHLHPSEEEKKNLIDLFEETEKEDRSAYWRLRETFNKKIRNLIFEQYGFERFTTEEKYRNAHVEYRSQIRFPTNVARTHIHKEFVNEYFDFICNNDRVLIACGDDNYNPPLVFEKNRDVLFNLNTEVSFTQSAKKDKNGFWVLFDNYTGTKTRFVFDDSFLEKEEGQDNFPSAYTPELVDIKITGFCNMGCAFCYESSTKEGKPAKWEDLVSLVAVLKEMEVLEVAIGGGEPTSHKHLKDFCALLKENNISASFTTRNVSFLKNDKFCDEIFQHITGFAFSYNGEEDFQIFYEGWKKRLYAQYPQKVLQMTCHFVVGVTPLSEILHIMKKYKKEDKYIFEEMGFLLLGYKDFGFGESYEKTLPTKEEMKDFFEELKKEEINQIRVDTLFVSQYKEVFEQLEIPPVFYTDREGDFSMAIDAVERSASWSSYAPKKDRLYAKTDEEWKSTRFFIDAFHRKRFEDSRKKLFKPFRETDENLDKELDLQCEKIKSHPSIF